MSEVVEAGQAEVLAPLPPPMDLMDAQKLDGRIRRLSESARGQLVKIAELVEQAKQGRVHEVLGFKSWTGYLADALGGQLQLPGESRFEVVAFLAGEGLSTRAIAAATGVSKSTVANDLAQVSNDWTPQQDSGVQELDTSSAGDAGSDIPQPDTSSGGAASSHAVHDLAPESDGGSTGGQAVTGLDGKSYRKPKPAPKPKHDVSVVIPRKVVERIAPRIEAMAHSIDGLDPNEVDPDATERQVGMIRGAVEQITRFVDQVSPPKPPAEPDPEPARKPQIPTAWRGKIAALAPIIADLEELTKDPRWSKAVERLNANDVIALTATIEALLQLRAAAGGGEYSIVPGDDAWVPRDGQAREPRPPETGQGDADQQSEPAASASVRDDTGADPVRPSPASMPARSAKARDRVRTRGGNPTSGSV